MFLLIFLFLVTRHGNIEKTLQLTSFSYQFILLYFLLSLLVFKLAKLFMFSLSNFDLLSKIKNLILFLIQNYLLRLYLLKYLVLQTSFLQNDFIDWLNDLWKHVLLFFCVSYPFFNGLEFSYIFRVNFDWWFLVIICLVQFLNLGFQLVYLELKFSAFLYPRL